MSDQLNHKFASAAWKKAPVTAQIDAALLDLELVKSALMSLKQKAARLDKNFQSRIQSRIKSGKFGRYAVNDPAFDSSARDAESDLDLLQGGMQNPIETEIGLNVLVWATIDSPVKNFFDDRDTFIQYRQTSWSFFLRALIGY